MVYNRDNKEKLMSDRKYRTGEFAKKAGVSVRTVQFYEKKGLIQPSEISDSGYRFYNEAEFAKLQRILTLKLLGFSLDEIKELSMNEEDTYSIQHSFQLQLELVRKRIRHLQMVEASIQETSDLFQRTNRIDWDGLIKLIRVINMEHDLAGQYKNEKNTSIRIALHERYSTNPQNWFSWLFDQIPEKYWNRVLEVGCGNGAFWSVNAGRIPTEAQIVLSDISSGMLEDAGKNLAGEEQIQYQLFDCHDIPYGKDSFDLIIANHVLFYSKNIKAALSQIQRVMTADGMFLCATYGSGHMKEIELICKEFNPKISLSPVRLYEIFGLENGGEILKEFFHRVQKREYSDMLIVTEAQALLDYIMSCHGNQQEFIMPYYEEFKNFLERKMKRWGNLKITKQAGVFLCQK